MATFEEQLARSAQRISQEENKQLRVPQSPMAAGKRTYWGWVATPAAAVIGIVFGMTLPMLVGNVDQQVQLVQVHDTIRVPLHSQDTIFLTKVEERERIVWRDREPAPAESIVQEVPSAPEQSEALPQCTSVSCDGIDYSMLETPSVPLKGGSFKSSL